MKGNIYISGQIGSFDGVKGVELMDIISQVKKQPEAKSFDVYIDSEGGYVHIGFDIFNYLRSLRIPLNTIGSGVVASAATIIFMAGDTRTIRNNTQFMIHLPWGEAVGTADEVERYAKELRACEKNIVDFYKKTLSLSEEALRPLLIEETWLTNDQLSTLGFTTSKPVLAKAKAKIKTDNKMSNNKDRKGAFEQAKSWARSILGIKNKIVFDAENNEVDFYELGDEDTISVGAKATIGGEPASGSVVMADGMTYVFEAGELIEIIEVVEDEEMASLREENETLTSENAELIEAINGIKDKFEAIQKENGELKGKVEAYKKAQSRYAPEDKKDKDARKDKHKSAAKDAVDRLKKLNTNDKK